MPSHPFGDLVSQHLHRKHGLSQSKLAAGILQDPAVISEMCRGRRLTGPQARTRVIQIIDWLRGQGALRSASEADAILMAARMAPLNANDSAECALLSGLHPSHAPLTDALTTGTALAFPRILPPDPTPFIGREPELAELLTRICSSNCRLLTLLGPGGVGKSRLAIEAARRIEMALVPDGVYFVELASIETEAESVAEIARALRFSFCERESPRQQLINFLRDKRSILILDNVEQTNAGALFSAFLAQAPALKLLVTSREVLNLREEWVLPIQGLSTSADHGNDSDAMRLFIQCAIRTGASIAHPEALAAARRICTLTDGLPLAIELAASWLRALPIERLAEQIERGIDLLESHAKNVAVRHRSMRAVFDHSWSRLTAHEREVLLRLSVADGCALESAQSLCGASISTLAGLIDKSLLRAPLGGRYQMHALIRDLVAEKLRDDPDLHRDATRQHCGYFLQYVVERGKRLKSADQIAAMHELNADSGNIPTRVGPRRARSRFGGSRGCSGSCLLLLLAWLALR